MTQALRHQLSMPERAARDIRLELTCSMPPLPTESLRKWYIRAVAAKMEFYWMPP